MIKVPDLTADNALKFSGEIQDYQLSEGEVFDFSDVHNCDPFPMLVVSRTIWQLRKRSDVKKCVAHECNNGYAEHMRFYRAVGIKISSDYLFEDIGFERNWCCQFRTYTGSYCKQIKINGKCFISRKRFL